MGKLLDGFIIYGRKCVCVCMQQHNFSNKCMVLNGFLRVCKRKGQELPAAAAAAGVNSLRGR